MPSFLGDYPNAAKNREVKLRRAIISFLEQSYWRRELIIVSDGCDLTDKAYNILSNQLSTPIVKHVRLEKQPLFAGAVRNAGIQAASGDIIAYLDTDDIILPDHCMRIVEQFGENDWVYYDDYVATESLLRENAVRGNHPEFGHIGTSSIAHKKDLNIEWCDGYGHDWKFVEDLMATSQKYQKISGAGYVVCHVADRCDY